MNADAIKDFLFRHVEKFVFGALTLLALFLIYQGVQKPDILAKYQPGKLEGDAVKIKTSIDDDHWAAINSVVSRVPTNDIVAETNRVIQPVVVPPYTLPTIFDPIDVDSISVKRTDPKLPVPIDLQVKGVIASLAVKSGSNDYALKLLEPADPVTKDEKPKPKPPKRSGRGAESSMMESSMMESSMMDSSMMDSAMMEGGMSGMGMGSAAAGPGTRPIDKSLYDQGYHSEGVVANQLPATGWFIAGVALMPQKEIYAAYEKAFAEADDYNLNRDQPFYLGFQLQRADVTAKPADQLTNEDWTPRLSSRKLQLLLLRYWAGMAKEIVAGKYRDPELTASIPPVLLDNYAWFAAHPRIPLGNEPLPTATSAATKELEIPSGPLVPGTEEETFNNRARSGNSMSPGYEGMTMGSGGFGGMGGMGAFGMGQRVEQPEFKLIRFFDFHDFTGVDKTCPQPGRKYVYRIRIAVEDPNFPASIASQPRNSTLSNEVYKRVEKLTAQSNELAKTNPANSRNSMMWSDYSAPSAPVSLPGIFETFAGPVEPPAIKIYPIDANSSIEFQSKPPKAKVVVTKWSPQYGARLPIFLDVSRGTVVDKVGIIDVPDPIAMEVKKLPDATVKTSNVVLDITGGRPIGISPAEDQTEPGVLLMFDPMGGLEVVDEIESQRSYRLYSFADEREKP